MNIRKGDRVVVIAGNDRGSEGEVQRLLRGRWGKGRRAGERKPSADRVMVAGVNIIKKHQRRTGNVRTQFGIIEREAPVHISNVMLICPKCHKPTRVGYQIHEDGARSRVCKQCGDGIDA